MEPMIIESVGPPKRVIRASDYQTEPSAHCPASSAAKWTNIGSWFGYPASKSPAAPSSDSVPQKKTAMAGTAHTPYRTTLATYGESGLSTIHAITALDEYKSKSFEELRLEDYSVNRHMLHGCSDLHSDTASNSTVTVTDHDSHGAISGNSHTKSGASGPSLAMTSAVVGRGLASKVVMHPTSAAPGGVRSIGRGRAGNSAHPRAQPLFERLLDPKTTDQASSAKMVVVLTEGLDHANNKLRTLAMDNGRLQEELSTLKSQSSQTIRSLEEEVTKLHKNLKETVDLNSLLSERLSDMMLTSGGEANLTPRSSSHLDEKGTESLVNLEQTLRNMLQENMELKKELELCSEMGYVSPAKSRQHCRALSKECAAIVDEEASSASLPVRFDASGQNSLEDSEDETQPCQCQSLKRANEELIRECETLRRQGEEQSRILLECRAQLEDVEAKVTTCQSSQDGNNGEGFNTMSERSTATVEDLKEELARAKKELERQAALVDEVRTEAELKDLEVLSKEDDLSQLKEELSALSKQWEGRCASLSQDRALLLTATASLLTQLQLLEKKRNHTTADPFPDANSSDVREVLAMLKHAQTFVSTMLEETPSCLEVCGSDDDTKRVPLSDEPSSPQPECPTSHEGCQERDVKLQPSHNDMQAEVDALIASKKELMESVEAAREQLTDAEASVVQVSSRLKDLELEEEAAKFRSDGARADTEEVEKKLCEVQKAVEELNTRHQLLLQQIADSEIAVAKSKEEECDLKNRIEKASEDYTSLTDQTRTLRTESMERQKEEEARMQDWRGQAQIDIEAMEHTKMGLADGLGQLEDTVREKETKLAALEDSLQKVTEALASKETQLQDVKAAESESLHLQASIKAEVAALQEKQVSLASQIKNESERARQLEETRGSIEAEVAAMADRKDAVRADLDTAEEAKQQWDQWFAKAEEDFAAKSEELAVLQKQQEALTVDVETLLEERDALQSENKQGEELRAALPALREEVETLSQRRQSLSLEYQALQQQIERYVKERESINAVLERGNEDIQMLSSNMEVLQSDIEVLQTKKDSLEGSLAASREMVAQQQAAAEELQHLSEAARQQIVQQNEVLNTTTEHVRQMQNEACTLQKQREGLESDISERQEVLNTLKQSQMEHAQKLEAMAAELRGMEQSASQVSADVQTMKEELAALLSNKEATQALLRSLSEEGCILKETNQTLLQKHTELTASAGQLEQKEKQLKGVVNVLSTESERLRVELDGVTTQLSEAREGQKAAEAACALAARERDSRNAEAANLKNTIEVLSRERDELLQGLPKIRVQLSETRVEVDSLLEQKESLARDIVERTSVADALGEDIAADTVKAAELKTIIVELEAALAAVKTEEESTRALNEMVRTEYEGLQKRLLQSREAQERCTLEAKQIKINVEALQGKQLSLTNELEQLQERKKALLAAVAEGEHAVAVLRDERETAHADISQSSAELQALTNQLQHEKTELERITQLHEQEVESGTQRLNELQQQCSRQEELFVQLSEQARCSQTSVEELEEQRKQSEAQLAAVQESLKAAESERATLQSSLQSLQQSISGLQEEQARVASDLSTVQAESQRAREEVSTLHEEEQRARAAFEAASAELNEMSQELAELERRKEEALAKTAESTEHLHDNEVTVAELQAQQSELQQQQRELSQEVAGLYDTIADLSKKKDVLEQETSEAEALAVAARAQAEATKAELCEIETKKSRSANQVQILQKRIKELEVTVGALDGKKASREDSLVALDASEKDLKERIAEMERRLTKIESEHEARSEALRSQAVELQQDVASEETRLSGLRVEVSKLEQERDSVQATVDTLRKEEAAVGSSLSAFQREKGDDEKYLQEIREKRAEGEKALEALRKSHEDLRTKVEEARNRLAVVDKEKSAIDAEASKIRSVLKDLEEEEDRVKASVDAFTAQISELETTLKERRGECTRLEDRKSTLEASLENLAAQKTGLERTLESLSSQLEQQMNPS